MVRHFTFREKIVEDQQAISTASQSNELLFYRKFFRENKFIEN